MRRTLLIVLAAALLMTAFVPAAAGEKQPDGANYTITNRTDTVAGNLTGSPVFNRRWDVTLGLACNATSSDSASNGQSYQVFNFYSPGGQLADIATVAGTLTDSYIFIYCNPFNPAAPDQNLVFADDDDGPDLMSAITPADGVQLTANTQYQLVVCGYSSSSLGTYTLNLGNDLVFGTPGPPPPVPTVNRWGLFALVGALALAGFFLLRRLF